MNIILLAIYIMLWILGLCASYAFVMTITKKDVPLSFLRWSSLIALLSYGVAWFFGVLYYVHPDTIVKLARAVPADSNLRLQSFFAEWREYIFFSFLAVLILAGTLATVTFLSRNAGATDLWVKRKNTLMFVSILLTIFGSVALLLVMMIA